MSNFGADGLNVEVEKNSEANSSMINERLALAEVGVEACLTLERLIDLRSDPNIPPTIATFYGEISLVSMLDAPDTMELSSPADALSNGGAHGNGGRAPTGGRLAADGVHWADELTGSSSQRPSKRKADLLGVLQFYDAAGAYRRSDAAEESDVQSRYSREVCLEGGGCRCCSRGQDARAAALGRREGLRPPLRGVGVVLRHLQPGGQQRDRRRVTPPPSP